MEADCTGKGVLASIMHSSRSQYHRAIIDDIPRCYLSSVGQIKEMPCYFRNLGVSAYPKLLHSFGSSLYDAEL